MNPLLFKCAAAKLLVVVIAESKGFVLASANAAHLLWKMAAPTHGGEVIATERTDHLAALATRHQKILLLVTAWTKSLCRRTSLAAASALSVRPSALSAQVVSVLSPIIGLVLFVYWLSATGTGRCVVMVLPFVLVIVLFAKPKSPMGRSTEFAKRLYNERLMKLKVLRLIRKHSQILNAIVSRFEVSVMNYFLSLQKSAKRSLDHQHMLWHETLLAGPRIASVLDHHVSVLVGVFLSLLVRWLSDSHCCVKIPLMTGRVNTIFVLRHQTQ
jgi:hypothetical protein